MDPDLADHLDALEALADALEAAGHEVLCALVDAAWLRHVAPGERLDPVRVPLN